MKNFPSINAGNIGHWETFTKHQQKKKARTKVLDILNDCPPLAITIAVVQGKDGIATHAVSVVGNIIFDSTLPHALPLNKECLDWCCNCEGGFDFVFNARRYWLAKSTKKKVLKKGGK